jgi:hypothetical protein
MENRLANRPPQRVIGRRNKAPAAARKNPVRLSNEFVRALTGSTMWWDDDPKTTGFGVRSYASGAKSFFIVNAAAKMHRLAGAKIHQRCWQEGPRTGGLFVRHQACVGLSAAVSELAGRERRLL